MDSSKLSKALTKVVGKTINRIFLVPDTEAGGHIYFVFSDGTHYEFYGVRDLSGARCVDPGDADEVRHRLARSDTQVIEIQNASA